MRNLTFKIAFLLSLFLSACATVQQPSRQYDDPQISTKPHTLLIGEQIQLTVFGQVELSRTYRIDDKGSISMPLLGNVLAINKTPNEFAHYVAFLLSQKYIKNPSVSIEMITYSPIYITGAIKNAGQFVFIPGMTAEAAIVSAGGFLESANKTIVKITRRDGGTVLENNVALQTPLAAGDIVRVYGSISTNN